MNNSPWNDPFTSKSLMWSVSSMVLGIADYCSDIAVAIALGSDDESSDWWLALTILFAIIPLVLVNIFSIFWFHQDHLKFRKYSNNITKDECQHGNGIIFQPPSPSFTKNERKVIITTHLFGFGPILR